MKDRLIPAIDVTTREDALHWVNLLQGHVSIVKIGLRLFIAEGPEIVREIRKTGMDVFLDLKLHDIPSTVEAAASVAAKLDVKMMTVHASGGAEMIRAACRGAARRTGIIAVTVLTSLDANETEAIFRDARTPEQRVLEWADMAIRSGADGVVASPREASVLRKALPATQTSAMPYIITPGIRETKQESSHIPQVSSATSSNADDQSRVATAGQAIADGASHIVVGRPILASARPIEVIKRMIGEMEEVNA